MRRVALLLLPLLFAFQPALGAPSIEEATSAAEADAASAEGRKFGEALGKAFGKEHGRTVGQCAKEAKRADLSNFDLFVRVDAAGVVDQALVAPATTLAICVRGRMPGWKVGAPPHAGFWVKVAVNLKPR